MRPRLMALLVLICLVGAPIALANHPGTLPDTITTPSFSYAVNYTNDNPYNPASPPPSPDMNFFPDGQAQNIANALNNGAAATAGNPNGYHDGYTSLGFLAPDFGGTPRNVNVFDCGPHGGCDSGNAPADRIQMPATGYITQSEACLRLVIGHELFHHVQYSYITFGKWSAWGGVPVEGTARLMQDKIYSDLDANAGCITYQGEANNLLNSPNQTLWNISYTSALFWNYLTERLGVTAAEPQRGADFVRRFWERAQANNASPDLIGTLRQTIADFDTSVTLESLFQDFTIANYAKNLDLTALADALRYSYRDENPGTADVYQAVATTWSGNINPSTPKGPQADSVVRWGARYYVANINDCRGVIGFIGDGDQAAYSLIAVRSGNRAVKVSKATTGHFARAMINSGADPVRQLVAVVAGTDDAANYNYTFACGSPKVDIVEPTNVRQAYVGEKTAPDRFLVRLRVTGPTLLGDPTVEGLSPADFRVFVDDPAIPANQATVLSGARVQGEYWLVVQAPNKGAGPDTYPLFVQLGDIASDAEQNAVVYQKLILDQVLVVDRSGSMLDPAGSPKIEAARNAASLLVDAARSADRIGVVSFSGDNVEPNDDAILNDLLQPVNDAKRTQAKAAIAGLAAGGMTSIGDGLKKGADEFPVRGGPGEDWLVLLSDGMQNEARFWNDPAVRGAIQAANIKVNTIALGPLTDQALLQQIASETGGTYYYVDVGTVARPAGPSLSAAAFDSGLANRLSDAFAASTEVMQRHERIWEDAGVLGGTEVKTITVGEGGVADGLFSFNWSDGAGMDVEIRRPDGTLVVDGVGGARVFRNATHYVARVGTVAPGAWSVTLRASAGSPEWLGLLSGRDTQGAQLRLQFGQLPAVGSPSLFMRGLPMPIIANLTDAKGPVLGATVFANVQHPDGSVIRLPLLDDGGHGDGEAADGVYANFYTRTTEASPTNYTEATAQAIRGSYNVSLEAGGADNFGDQFSRIRKGSFQVFEGVGRNEKQIDTDKDGMPDRYEELHSCLDPAKDDAGADPDQDGIKNLKEWDLGVDPCYVDTDRGGEGDRSELGRNANVFDPQDDALPRPIDVEVVDYVLDHLPPPDLRPGSNLIRYPVHPSYAAIRLLRSLNPGGPFTPVAEFDAQANGGLYHDDGLVNDTTYYYQLEGVDLNGNPSAPSHVFSGTPKDDPFPPRGNVQIAGGRPIVRGANVTLTLTADADTAEMQISNSATFAGAVWEPFQPTRAWTLAPDGRGYAIVFVRFRDGAQNVGHVLYDDVRVRPLFSWGLIVGQITLRAPLLGAHADHDALLSGIGAQHAESPPLVGAMVSSPDHPDWPPTFTDESGRFRYEDLPDGTYTLRIQQTGYAPYTIRNVVVSGGEATVGTVELHQGGAFLPLVTR